MRFLKKRDAESGGGARRDKHVEALRVWVPAVRHTDGVAHGAGIPCEAQCRGQSISSISSSHYGRTAGWLLRQADSGLHEPIKYGFFENPLSNFPLSSLIPLYSKLDSTQRPLSLSSPPLHCGERAAHTRALPLRPLALLRLNAPDLIIPTPLSSPSHPTPPCSLPMAISTELG
jgi:hypothetical protein